MENLESVLLACLTAKRSEKVDKENIEKDADAIYKAGEQAWGTDDKTFIQILSSRSHEHLKCVAQKYKEKYNKTLEDAIKGETSGYYESALLACIELPEVYFAKRVHSAVSGLGTNDSRLRRVFLLNSKSMLAKIAVEYKKLYEKSLVDVNKGDTTGHIRKNI